MKGTQTNILMLFHHQTRGDIVGTIISQDKNSITVRLYAYSDYIDNGNIICNEVLPLNRSLITSFAPLAN